MKRILAATILLLSGAGCPADDAAKPIAMRVSAAGTFYIPVYLQGLQQMDFLVDTGSSHTVINERTLAVLQANGQAKYAAQISGTTADGVTRNIPLYTLQAIDIGHNCVLRNVEVAVFPGETRQILGLSTLSKVGSLVFSMSPPALQLANCHAGPEKAGNAPIKVSALP